MNDEFENALAWFSAAPTRWINSAQKDLSGCAEWIWEVLQGDFNENASTAQLATGTVISMIPFVDQICDLRDFIANCKNITSDKSNQGYWAALILTLIGLFPTVGSLLKGCAKVMFASVRTGSHLAVATPKIARAIHVSIIQLNQFIARPEVKKTLKYLKINNPYKYLAKHIRAISAKISVGQLLTAFGEAKKAAENLLNLVSKWGGDALADRATKIIRMLEDVQRTANKPFEQALKPVKNFLDQLARRLDIEADLSHRAYLNTVNPHAFARITDAAEDAEFAKKIPSWADLNKGLPNTPLTQAPPAPTGWKSTAPDMTRAHPLDNAHETFKTMIPTTIPPGEKLYRVIAPNSLDNSICWMREAEFKKLGSKDDWRRKFAVWSSWNRNGEYVTYVVPPGKGLNVWEGVTASQAMKNNPNITLEGGAIQLVINPDDLQKSMIGKRQPTNWGYDDYGTTSSLIGVPTLTNNWKTK